MPEEISQIPPTTPPSVMPKPSISKKTSLIIVGILALVFIIGIFVLAYLSKNGTFNKPNQSKPTQTSTTTPTSVGKEFTVNSGVTITLEEVKLDASFEKEKTAYRQYLKSVVKQSDQVPKEPESLKQNKLDLKIAFKNTNTIAATYNPARFRLKDNEDIQYQAESTGDPLAIYSVNTGETTKVHIYFTVPSSEKKFKLIYENATINFSLP